MPEIWLNPNRRVILFGCVPPLAVVMFGLWLMFSSNTIGTQPWRWIGVILLFLGGGMILLLMRQFRRPRMAYQNGHVLFYLRSGPPIAVPADVVEAFFAGQSPAGIPGIAKQPQSANLIARLSRRHTEWAEQTVKPALGNWSEGYVTVRGTWCEPLSAELIRKLNRRLKEVKDAR
jgi:peptidoglycan/LPS O-acetylase OafA/YrhL